MKVKRSSREYSFQWVPSLRWNNVFGTDTKKVFGCLDWGHWEVYFSQGKWRKVSNGNWRIEK